MAFDITNPSPAIAAHRGASRRYPENTLAAIKEAINIAMEHPNVRFFIEMDVRKSADNALVIMHDSNVARTTYGRGFIEDKSLAEIEALPVRPLSDLLPTSKHCPDRVANPLFSISEADMKVPTLDEVMALVNTANQTRTQPIGLALEIKSTNHSKNPIRYGFKSLLHGISELLNYIGLPSSADMIYSSHHTSSALAHYLNSQSQALPPLLIFSSAGLTGKRDLETLWSQLAEVVKQQLCPEGLNTATPSVLVDEQIGNGKARIALEAIQHTKRYWAIGTPSLIPMVTTAKPRNSRESIAAAITNGANFIASDFPDRAISVLKERLATHDTAGTHTDFSFLGQELERRSGKNSCKHTGMNGCKNSCNHHGIKA